MGDLNHYQSHIGVLLTNTWQVLPELLWACCQDLGGAFSRVRSESCRRGLWGGLKGLKGEA